MTKYKSQGFRNTFKNARNGLGLSIKSERNLRIHILIAALVISAAMYFNFSGLRICVVILTITAVIAAEMLNSAIEFTLDSFYHNKYSRMVGMAKDIAAGSVMVVTFAAIAIGVILFTPPIIKLFL